MTAVRFLAPRVPITDPNTGVLSREWYLFLQNLFPSQSSSSVDDVQLSSSSVELSGLRDEVCELRKAIDDIRKGAFVL